MKKKNNRKGLTGPRSRSFRDDGSPPPPAILGDIEIRELPPMEEELEDTPQMKHPSQASLEPGGNVEAVDYRTDARGVVDQRKPRHIHCGRCYGGGQLPGRRMGEVRYCPDCKGTGKITPEDKLVEKRPTPTKLDLAASLACEQLTDEEIEDKHAEFLAYDPDYRKRDYTPPDGAESWADWAARKPAPPPPPERDPPPPPRASQRRSLPGLLGFRRRKPKTRTRRDSRSTPPWEAPEVQEQIAAENRKDYGEAAPWD